MASILIVFFTLILVLICACLVLVVLMQRPSANAGMGAALGGGAAEGIFGGEAGNVLTKLTVRLTVLFFLLSTGLYLGYIYVHKEDRPAQKNIQITSGAPQGAAAEAPVQVPTAETPLEKAE